MELNPTQKDLVLKIAELLCKNDVTDGRAKYWVERAAKLFPGSPAIYKLKVKKKKKTEENKAYNKSSWRKIKDTAIASTWNLNDLSSKL